MPGYVQVLAGDVVNGNPANANYQGQPLGNLAVGSSAAQLNDLVNKWFYGHRPARRWAIRRWSTNRPPARSSRSTPSHADEYQGELGDCYFISSLGTLADSNPAAIENMFINNGDGTYTVRFYTGTVRQLVQHSNGSISDGFTNGVGTADYVTVNSMLPTTTSGMLVYADYGASYTNAGQLPVDPLGRKGLCPVEPDRQGRPRRRQRLRRHPGRMDGHGRCPGARLQCHRLHHDHARQRAGGDQRAGRPRGGDDRHGLCGRGTRSTACMRATPTRSSATTPPATPLPCTIPGDSISRARSPGLSSRLIAPSSRLPALRGRRR